MPASISVIITTANRTSFLRDALASVARQTVLDRVLEVVVIENGGCIESAALCKEMTCLPIRYVYNNPPFDHSRNDPPLHNRYLYSTFINSRPNGDYIALLHDDDQWFPCHLESALASFHRFPRACASFAASVFWHGNGALADLRSRFFPWLVSGHGPVDDPVELSTAQVLMATLFETSFSYSTLTASSTTLIDAVKEATVNARFDSDRRLAASLSRRGAIAYSPRPTCCIRVHAGQESVLQGGRHSSARKAFEVTSIIIREYLRDIGVDPGAELARLASVRGVCIADLARNQSYDSIVDCVENSGACSDLRRQLKRYRFREWVRRNIPFTWRASISRTVRTVKLPARRALDPWKRLQPPQ
jgi:glycosyltransferase involved in cell wall biosynthesis